MKLNFQQEVLCLPASILSHADADSVKLRVLLWLASDLSLAGKHRQLAKLAECDTGAVQAAIDFWCERGVLTCANTSASEAQVQAPAASTARKRVPAPSDESPVYKSEEIAEILERQAPVREMIQEAQRVFGKMFNSSDLNVLITMNDHLGLSPEAILAILAHSKRIGKNSMRAVEKYAYKLVDDGITEPEALEEEFRTVEALHSFEGEVRRMFGMKSRAMTTKESKMLRAWVSYGYDVDAIRRAYELTIESTREPTMNYANAIIERWNSENLRTLEQIDADIAEFKDKKNGIGKPKKDWLPTLGNSFDTDDFFNAALERSFREFESENKQDGAESEPFERK